MADPTSKHRLALFPASFDPITNGHLDLIERCRALFDQTVIAVARNVSKSATFNADERTEAIGASAIIRGLRAIADFEYEFEMALMNNHLAPNVEILFFMTSQEYMYVSSSRLKELVRFGASVDEFVPSIVAEALKRKLG